MRLSFVQSLMLAAAAAAQSQAAAAAESWRIDPARTRIGFTIESSAWPTTRGSFQKFDGRVSLDFDHPARSSVRFSVQSSSVEAGSKGLNDYIRSAVFFDAAKYPTMSFASTAVTKVDDRTVQVQGDLTLLGVTKPITLTVNVDRTRRGGAAVGLSARGQVMRSAFGMNSGVPIINDRVDIVVTTEAVGAP
ncbi:YceI family protein [Terrarubrum flagellatum]|uniref:YceI family protein n=1 Tax=Terrirubrum flagellatum TaxID=2895980 RepID=UPI00314536CE